MRLSTLLSHVILFSSCAVASAWAQQAAMPEVPAAETAAPVESKEGIVVEGTLVGVVQRAGRSALADGAVHRTRANVRGDIGVTLPGGQFAGGEGTAFVQARLGQGAGVVTRDSYTGAVNSTTFFGSDPDHFTGTLAQAWYQFALPVGASNSQRTARLTVGKIDPFGFFDQNAIADDETRHFVNNVFVHNPLLDSGGDIGANGYGFSPGAVAEWEDKSNAALGWGASVGVFGSGSGETFRKGGGKKFVIAQAWVSPRWGGLPGTYRVLARNNPRGSSFDDGIERHSGVGVSAEQGVTESLTLFARYGRQGSGRVRFDSALTLGGELDGALFGREGDGLGFAVAALHTSSAFARSGGASGSERIAELYYRIRLSEHVEITPGVQHVSRPAGRADARGITVWGVRARVGF